MERLPSIPVHVSAITPRHVLQLDTGQLVHVRSTYSAGPGHTVFVWVAAGPVTGTTPRIGTIKVADTATVECVRVADMLAARRARQAVSA